MNPVAIAVNPGNDLDGDTTETGAPLEAPVSADGTPFRYEMIFGGSTRRAYANEPDDLINVLAPGYTDLGHDDQWSIRLALAARAQVYAQALANNGPAFAAASTTDKQILSGTRHEPVIVPHWDCPIPLVLIATDYAPAGKAPRPAPLQGMPANVIYLDPSDDMSLLMSLHDVTFVTIHEAAPATNA